MNDSNQYLLDSNIFLRLFMKDEPKQARHCQLLFLQIQNQQLNANLPGIVFSEVAWTLKTFYKQDKPQINRALSSMYGLFPKPVDKYDYNLALKFFSLHNIKFIDCLIASIPQLVDKEMTLITYDQDFAKLPIKTSTPGQIIK